MVNIDLAVGDLASLRFAISPSWELVVSLRTLATPGAHVAHLPWVQRHRAEVLSDPGLQGLVALTQGTGPLPGFLAAPPDGAPGDPAHEIDAILAVDPSVIVSEITAVFGPQPPAALQELVQFPDRAPRLLHDQMRRYWKIALAAHWPRMLGLLEGDLIHRGRRLASAGPAALFGELDPSVSWSMDGRLTIEMESVEVTHTLSGRGLVLVPSVFAWPRVYVKASDPWQPVVRYPVRGVGVLWEQSGHEDGCDLAASLGATRARLLALTEDPRTTTELARATGLSAGGISVHLDRLVRSGLLVRHRQGRTVAYARTPKAELLLS